MVKATLRALFIILAVFITVEAAAVEDRGISEIEKDIAKDSRKVDSLRLKAKDILKEIDSLEGRIVRLKEEVEGIRRRLREGKRNIRHLEGKINEGQKAIEGLSRRMARRLVSIYKFSRPSAASLLLESEGPAQGLKMLSYLKRLAQYDVSLAEKWERLILSHREHKDELLRELDELRALEGEAKEKEASLKQAKVKKIALLKQIHNRESLYLAHLEELKSRLKELRARLKAKEMGEGRGLEGLKGLLNPPVKGEVVQGFGLKKHPKFGTKVRSDGIYIRATGSMEVRPIVFGRVVYAGYIAGLDHVVILDHGKGYFSIYGGMEVLYTEEGQRVEEKSVLGLLPEDESGRLYFEIRHHDRPLNPTKWLRLSAYKGDGEGR